VPAFDISTFRLAQTLDKLRCRTAQAQCSGACLREPQATQATQATEDLK
jgi:hypothetical protein